WEHYLSCDGSPDPTVLQEINTFMSLWREEQNEDVQLVMEKGEQVLNLIEKLQFLLLDTPPSEITEKETDQYQESILALQNLLHQKYNEATEHLLKVTNMYEDPETGNMQAVIKDKNVTFCIWANLKKEVRFKSHVFIEAQHGFDLPKALAVSGVAVRVLHTRYDHVSPSTVSFKGSSTSPADTNETEEETEKSEILDVPSQGIWLVFLCSVAEDPLMHEERREKEEAVTDENVVDLQQFLVVGGVYHLDALRLPPQVKQLQEWSLVELRAGGLEAQPYPPAEAAEATHPPVQITLRLSDHVVYFGDPVVARWDPAGKQWRTDGISSVRHETQERSVTFEMSAFYTTALLQDAHLNMPYHAWELQPAATDEALLVGDQCLLSSVLVGEKDALSHITGKWMSPVDLQAVLKKAGVNIFPEEYSHNYVPVKKKVSPKGSGLLLFIPPSSPLRNIRLEELLEHLKAGSDKDWSLYMFNGQKAQKLRITETSEAFSEELEEDSEFHSTLYHLLKDLASTEAIAKVETAGFLFVDTVYQLLLATRVLAYS
ncbi:CASC1 protein, partial [Halcyon senegalensis]|nr:CASC1 protein [Halcyon senegalensis]